MDFDQSFIDKLLPHVKSFAYTWFHLQAVKRKHFKSQDKRMHYDDELRFKQQFQNDKPNVKIKWAIRLLMKLRKDVHRLNQKDLIDVITGSRPTNGECVLSNPDMKGKMRRIDCLRQSDKVWRLDLVMVVLFKGVPLESSDGERLDKLPECKHPALCINPNHALLNVRDLEVFLANYINNSYKLTSNQSNAMLYHNIRSPSVFTPQEFLSLSEMSILNGASEADIKSSLVTTGSLGMQNQYASDENDDEAVDDKSCLKNLVQSTQTSGNSESDTPVKKKKKKESLDRPKSNIRINELLEQMEKGQKLGDSAKPDFEIKVETGKKGPLKRRRSSNQIKLNGNVTVLDDNAITDPSDAPVTKPSVIDVPVQAIADDQSSHSQQDDEIKELLKSNEKPLNDQQFKSASQKEKTDLMFKKLLNSNTNGDIANFLPVDTHAIKAATPVFELLMSPLFNSILPNSNSNSSSSTASSNSANSTCGQHLTKTNFNNSISAHQKSSSPTNLAKKVKLDNKTKNCTGQQINTSLINALKFESNLNASFDELFNNLTQHTNSLNNQQNELTQQQQEFINKLISLSPTFQFINKPKSRTHTPKQADDEGEKETSSSPPPPPSIGTSVNSNTITVVPEPTKIVNQSSSAHVQMHRPIPMLQKADAVMSSLMSNLNKTDSNVTNHTNSPIMFNSNSLLSSNSNFFSSYPNISPANCINGHGSPTSSLFPSISSLFQSPIGTPRVTPTPQQFAAYFLSEDQYHSFIMPANVHQDDQSNSFNLCQSSNGHLSPLIFNNIINSSQLDSQSQQSQSANSKTSNNVVVGTNN